MEIIEGIGEILGAIFAIKDLILDLFGQVKETTDVIVQGGTEIIGFADAVKQPITYVTGFLNSVFPSDFVTMVGIGFTVLIALATRRSIQA